MIIQTGMRTDIPAFYSTWFANRLKEGYVLVRNPYNKYQVSKYRLNPDVVDIIAFCTKNPSPMFRYMELLKPYGQFWFVTITPYGSDIEPNVPDKELVISYFRLLSGMVGSSSISWRYDPILLDKKHTISWHLSEFEAMASALEGYTESVVISFIDIYKKVLRNYQSLKEVGSKERFILCRELVGIAKKYGMVVRPCAEGSDLNEVGADCSGCMTEELLERAYGKKLKFPKKNNQRNGACTCVLGSDIGAYDTCGHLCRYCYANADIEAVKLNMSKHDPLSPFLIGHSMAGDHITEVLQKSWKDPQPHLDLGLEF